MEIKRVEERIVIDRKESRVSNNNMPHMTPRLETSEKGSIIQLPKFKLSNQNVKEAQSLKNSPNRSFMNTGVTDIDGMHKQPEKMPILHNSNIFTDIQNYSLAEALENFKKIKKSFKLLETLTK